MPLTVLSIVAALALAGQAGPADSLRLALLERIGRDRGATVAVALLDPAGGFRVLVTLTSDFMPRAL